MRGLNALRHAAAVGLAAFSLAGAAPRASANEPKGTPATSASAPASWCAADLETLPNDVCAFLPTKEGPGPRTLVIFLHGVIQHGTTWQWAQ